MRRRWELALKDQFEQGRTVLFAAVFGLLALMQTGSRVSDGAPSDRLPYGWIGATITLGLIALLVTGVLLREARQVGGHRQLRLYRRAVGGDGVLPPEADANRWYPKLQRLYRDMAPNVLVTTALGGFLAPAVSALLGIHSPPALWATLAIGCLAGAAVGVHGAPERRRKRENVEILVQQIEQIGREDRQRHSW